MDTALSTRSSAPPQPTGDTADPAPVLGVVDAIPRLAAFALVGIGVVGTPLLLAGHFDRLPVGAGAGALFVLLELTWRRARPRRGRAARGTAIVSLLALMVALASAGVNARYSDQHLLVDGDPAAYAVTGQLIADHGTLAIPTRDDAVFGDTPTLNYAGAGFDAGAGDDTVRPSFLHLLPEVLAVASWAGGAHALLKANAVLAGFALLAVFAFGARLVRPVWALVAMSALALTLPQQHFSRDTFSEIPSQLLVFAGLTLLFESTRHRPLRLPVAGGAVAGLTLAASCITRIDAFFYLVPLAAFLAVLALARAGRVAAGVGGGLAVAAVSGYLDLRIGSSDYLRLQEGNLHMIWAALAAVVVVGGVAVALRGPVLACWERARGKLLGAAFVGVVGAVAIFGYAVRPHVEAAHNTAAGQPTAVLSLQKAEGLPIDPGRSYDELSLHWLAWYIGPVALALGIAGFAWLGYRLLRARRDTLPTLAFVLVFGASTALYVWKPSIVPVQYWATRRFLPVTFPGLLLCAAWLAAGLWALRPGVRRRAGRHHHAARSTLRPVTAGLALLVVPALLVPPALYLRGHGDDREYLPMLAAVHDVCGALAPNDAVLVLGGSQLATGIPQTVQAFCRVPVAVISGETRHPQLAAVYRAVHRAGKRLVYLSPVDNRFIADGSIAGDYREVTDVTLSAEALSLSHRPDARYSFPLTIWFAVAPRPA